MVTLEIISAFHDYDSLFGLNLTIALVQCPPDATESIVKILAYDWSLVNIRASDWSLSLVKMHSSDWSLLVAGGVHRTVDHSASRTS